MLPDDKLYDTATNSQPFRYYSGPTTKHPLLEKYLYWPLRSNSPRASDESESKSQLKSAFMDKGLGVGSSSSSSSLNASSRGLRSGDKNNNGRQVTFKLEQGSSNLADESQSRSGARYEGSLNELDHQKDKNDQRKSTTTSSIYSRVLSSGSKRLSFGRYGKNTDSGSER